MCSIKASLQVYRSRGTEGQQHTIARSTVRFGENTDTRRQSKKVWWRTQVVYTPWDSWILSLSVCLFYFVVLNRYYYDWGIEWMKISFVTVPEFPCQAAMFLVFGVMQASQAWKSRSRSASNDSNFKFNRNGCFKWLPHGREGLLEGRRV